MLTVAAIFSSKAYKILNTEDGSRSVSQTSAFVKMVGGAEEWAKYLPFKHGGLCLDLQTLM